MWLCKNSKIVFSAKQLYVGFLGHLGTRGCQIFVPHSCLMQWISIVVTDSELSWSNWFCRHDITSVYNKHNTTRPKLISQLIKVALTFFHFLRIVISPFFPQAIVATVSQSMCCPVCWVHQPAMVQTNTKQISWQLWNSNPETLKWDE